MGICLSGGAKVQSVLRLATDSKFRGSNPSVGTLNTSSPRFHPFLCLHNVRNDLIGRRTVQKQFMGDTVLRKSHVVKLIFYINKRKVEGIQSASS